MTNEYEKFVKGEFEKVDKFQIITSSNLEEFNLHHKKWGFFGKESDTKDLKPGKIFLYEKYISDRPDERIYYPKIGIYINSLPCDQTIEFEWVDLRRNWEYNKKFEWNNNGTTKSSDFCYLSSQVNSLPLWNDDILIYGAWDKLPGWKELKPYYQKTWWYHKTTEEKRNIIINHIIKNG